MTSKTTYNKPQIKIYAVRTSALLADSGNTKSMSVGGNDTDTQLSKGNFDYDED